MTEYLKKMPGILYAIQNFMLAKKWVVGFVVLSACFAIAQDGPVIRAVTSKPPSEVQSDVVRAAEINSKTVLLNSLAVILSSIITLVVSQYFSHKSAKAVRLTMIEDRDAESRESKENREAERARHLRELASKLSVEEWKLQQERHAKFQTQQNAYLSAVDNDPSPREIDSGPSLMMIFEDNLLQMEQREDERLRNK